MDICRKTVLYLLEKLIVITEVEDVHTCTLSYTAVCSYYYLLLLPVYLTIMSVSIYGDTVNICSVCVTC